MTALTQLLATSATGYGAVIDGVLNIRTVTDTPNAAALNALYVCGIQIVSTCNDTDCDCMLKVAAHLRPDIKIVPVKIEVTK